MVKLDSAVHNNELFVKKVLQSLHQANLKRSDISENEELLCQDSKYVLQRKLARFARDGVRGKLVLFHAFDAMTLFTQVIRDTIMNHFIADGHKVDLFILADINTEILDTYVDAIANDKTNIYAMTSFTTLQSRINTGKFDKTIIINFDRSAKYLPCDLFIYAGLHLTSCEIRSMFNLSILDDLSKFIIIDTVTQRNNKHTRFIGRTQYGLDLQNSITYFVLKNSHHAGQMICQLLNKVILEESNQAKTTQEDDFEEESDEAMNGEDDSHLIRDVISQNLAVFVDRDTDNYLLNFIHQYIGPIKYINLINHAWFASANCIRTLKVVVFCYIRSVPDFRDIAAFVNAWKTVHDDLSELIVFVLISPILEKATAESLAQYKSDFNSLITLASSVNCCTGMHCEQTLFRQYVIDEGDCISTGVVYYDDVTQVIMKIFHEIELFVRNRANSFQPVFQEKELLNAISHFPSDLNPDIVSSFLYRGIPFWGKDGIPKIVTKLFDRTDVFIIKNDYQKYINVSTLTGIDFGTPVHEIIGHLHEEFDFDEMT